MLVHMKPSHGRKQRQIRRQSNTCGTVLKQLNTREIGNTGNTGNTGIRDTYLVPRFETVLSTSSITLTFSSSFVAATNFLANSSISMILPANSSSAPPTIRCGPLGKNGCQYGSLYMRKGLARVEDEDGRVGEE